jgi:hypothetical protein
MADSGSKMGCPKMGTKWQTLVQKWDAQKWGPNGRRWLKNGMPKNGDQMADSGPNLMSKAESDDDAKFADSNTEIDGVQLLSCFFPLVLFLIGRPKSGVQLLSCFFQLLGVRNLVSCPQVGVLVTNFCVPFPLSLV